MQRDKSFCNKLKNPFLVSSILILLLGSYYIVYKPINGLYSPQYPLYINNSLYASESYYTEVTCYSLTGKDRPVAGDIFRCNILFSDKNLSDNYNISDIENLKYTHVHFPRKNDETEFKQFGGYRTERNNSVIFNDTRIVINEPGLNELIIYAYKYWGDSNYVSTPYLLYESVSLDEYGRWKGSEFPLLVSAIALLFSVALIGMKNLMDIWDRKRKN